VSVECCQVATSWSLVQRSPTECGVSKKSDREASNNEAAYGPQGAVEPLEGGGGRDGMENIYINFLHKL
jgi:hypothetical protein